MNNSFVIRPANENDISRLAEIGRQTFSTTYYDHFLNDFSLESLEKYLDLTFSHEAIQKEFDVESTWFYLAEKSDGECIGYMKLSAQLAPEPVSEIDSLCIERIYLSEKYHKIGLGRKLILLSIEFAKTKGKKSIWLGCWEGNTPTIEFYKRMGFEVVSSATFHITGSGYSDTDFILVKRI